MQLDTHESVEENVINISLAERRNGFRADVMVLSFEDYTSLMQSLGSRIQYVEVNGENKEKFEGIRITTASGYVIVLPDSSVERSNIEVFCSKLSKSLSPLEYFKKSDLERR